MKWVALALTVLSMATSAHAASFDCAKASTRVERMICHNPELSKRDEELAGVFRRALKDNDHKQDLRNEQLLWLRQVRDNCRDTYCLLMAYETRNYDLTIPLVQRKSRVPANPAGAGNDEHEKMKTIQAIIRKHAFQFSTAVPESRFCEEFHADFMSDKYVRAVAPDVETSDENDPRLERWHRCGHADIGGTRPDLYLMLSLLGGPPYRYYKLDMAGGRPKQEVIYTEAYRKGSEFAGTGETAYHWVDLDTCTLMGGAAVGNPLVVQNTPQKLPSRNVLVRYRATYLAVDLFEIGNTYEFRAQALDEESRHNGRYCAWKDVLKSSTPAK